MVHVRTIAVVQSFLAMVLWLAARFPVTVSFAEDLRFAAIAFVIGAGAVLLAQLAAERLAIVEDLERHISLLGAVAAGSVLAVAAITTVVGKGYATPLAQELAFAGAQHRDTLFHAAIANMIAHHGAISTGLDGPVAVAYHVLSHRFIGAIAWLTGAPMLTAYSLAMQAFVLPVLNFLFLLLLLAALSKWRGYAGQVAGAIAGLALLYFLSAFDSSEFLVSESHALALVIMTFALLAMAGVATKAGAREEHWRGAILAVCVWLASLSKISAGAVLACGVAAYFIAAPVRWPMRLGLAGVFGLAPFLLVLSTGGQGAEVGASLIGPFHFLMNYPRPALVQAIASMIAIALALSAWRRGQLPTRREFALVVMILAALASSELLNLPAGAAQYFANPGLWCAILVIAAFLRPAEWMQSRQGLAAAVAVLAIACGIDGARLASVREYRNDLQMASDGEVSPVRRTMAEALWGAGAPRRDLAAYVDPTVPGFWTTRPCWGDAFFIQAATATPVLAGQPPARCSFPETYGFAAYDFPDTSPASLSDAEICAAAGRHRYSRVMVFRSGQSALLTCGASGG